MEAVQTEKKNLSRYEIPLSEAKAKQWINALPKTDFGETTQRVFYGLVDFNRRITAPMTRVRIAEHLRPTVELLLANLQRHLSHQSFPLPKRSQKISDLQQSILLEFAGTYQLAALDMLTNENRRKRALQVAIYRVIDYLGQYLLSTYSVYIRTRDTVWHDIHHMYLLASEHQVDSIKFNDGARTNLSIEARYLQINVLALFKPYSMRQEEVARIARYIEENYQLVSISRELVAAEQLGDFVHAAMLNHDEPAVIMPYGDLPHSPTVRVFNLRKLVMKIDNFIDEVAYENASALTLTDGLSRNLAKRMVYHLTTIRNREHSRFTCNDKIYIVMGMNNILQVLESQHQSPASQQQEEDLLFGTMQYGNLYAGDMPNQEDSADNEPNEDARISIWTALNSSIGGYGLRWEGSEPSNARVGELVGLRDMTQSDNPWMVGVVKWMDYAPKVGLSCGVELLSVQVIPLTVERVFNKPTATVTQQQGLMLPFVEGMHQQEATLLLSAYTFNTGDELSVSYAGKSERIILGTLDECLGAFAYFRYKSVNEEQTQGKDNDFENLWDVL